MDKTKYALLIRYAARKKVDNLTDMTDEELIYFYENSLWGQAHAVGVAAVLVVAPIMDWVKKVFVKYAGEEE